MKNLEFPLISTKVKGLTQKYNLNDPKDRARYFEAKAGDEIAQIKKYLENDGSFIAYLLGKKNSGKGTYAKLFAEIFGSDNVTHVSVGDLVRETHAGWETFKKSKDFTELKKLYRGYISFDEAVEALLGRSTEKLLPTEFILALLKLKISQLKSKAIFIDGLPRETDQVSYSLYFRDLTNFRGDPDIFVIIDIPESVIDERIKFRRVCPLCQTSRNSKLLITTKFDYDPKTKEIFLVCDNPDCKGARMVSKEGDDLGIEPIRTRLNKDEEIQRMVFGLHGVPKVFVRNHVPVTEANQYFDDYEITPEYVLDWDTKGNKVKITEKPWSVKDDNGTECYSLLAAPVMVTMLKQLVEALNL